MGGKAFEGTTRRIRKEEIPGTVTWLMQKWPEWRLNPTLNLHQAMLGSAGKSETSGDIDLNLETTAYDQAQVARQLSKFIPDDHIKARPGTSQIFTAIPILGDPTKGYVQVDFMFGDFKWQEFSYWSAPKIDDVVWGAYTETGFKGLYRTEYLKALTAYNSDWVLEDKGQVIARVGPTFFHDRGLVWRYRLRPMRKDGKGRVQAFQEVTEAEFLALYPGSLTATRDVMSDPTEVIKFLLDSYADVHDASTLEALVRRVRRIYGSDQVRTIGKIFRERLSNLKVDIPEQDFRKIWLR